MEAVTELPGGPVIDTPKNHQRRALALPAFVVALVTEHLAKIPDDLDAFAFPVGRSTPPIAIRVTTASDVVSRALAAAGLSDVTPHDLRATQATRVADSHGVMVAARRLGHANASVTTRHYARAVDGRDADIARHLDHLGSGTAAASGTQRARRPRKTGQ